jgi:UDP-hydrolysing UDP-N-acetyl-D-glucosamine 2-epimerase
MNNMIKVVVFTGTRAEYGLLYWLLKDLNTDQSCHLDLLVSGTHLSPEFGYTIKQIEDDGFDVSERVDMLVSSDSAVGTVKSIGLGVIGFSDSLARLDPDVIVILGDRFEALAAAQTALILRIPIVHLHGGEITEGAYDDSIRHAITKLSYLHGTSNQEHRQRVIQLGETPDRVHVVGAMGLEYINRTPLMSKKDLVKSINFDLNKPFFIVTFHAVTLSDKSSLNEFQSLLNALDAFPDYQLVMTYPNADTGGRELIPILETYTTLNASRVFSITSLGLHRYLSAVKYASAVIGNSSSGIIEAPSLKTPTVNIGIRQNGRSAAKSVINCEPITSEIVKAINIAVGEERSDDFFENPYGEGNASSKVIDMIKSCNFKSSKRFYDIKGGD